MMRIVWPRRERRRRRRRAGGQLADDVELDRWRGRVGGDDGIAVDGAVGERRHVLVGGDVVGEDEADGVGGGGLDRGQRRAGVEHDALGVGEADHGLTVLTRSPG